METSEFVKEYVSSIIDEEKDDETRAEELEDGDDIDDEDSTLDAVETGEEHEARNGTMINHVLFMPTLYSQISMRIKKKFSYLSHNLSS
jgi:hypothetical protein